MTCTCQDPRPTCRPPRPPRRPRRATRLPPRHTLQHHHVLTLSRRHSLQPIRHTLNHHHCNLNHLLSLKCQHQCLKPVCFGQTFLELQKKCQNPVKVAKRGKEPLRKKTAFKLSRTSKQTQNPCFLTRPFFFEKVSLELKICSRKLARHR